MAGPITGLSYDSAVDWRQNTQRVLWEEGKIESKSPMRGKEYLSGERVLNQTYKVPLSTQKGIWGRDKWDVRGTDAVLFNLLGAEKVSIGTMVEYGWATAMDKLIVTVMEEDGNVHDHVFVREASTFLVHSLDEAIDILLAIGGSKVAS